MTMVSDPAREAAITSTPSYMAPTSAWTRERLTKLAGRSLLYLMLAVGAVIISLPVFWMVLSSLKSNSELHAVPVHILPREPAWNNYTTTWFLSNVSTSFTAGQSAGTRASSVWPRLLANTLLIAAFTLTGTLLSNALVAFGFSRLRWRGRNVLFFVVLASMMLPSQVTMIPQYLIFTKIFKWTNTWYPQIVPAFFGTAWAIFLLRQYMMTIPIEIDEAARLDGCNSLQLFWHVIVPMSRPALGAIAIFTFTNVWNDFFTPLLYVREMQLSNVAVGLSAMRLVGTLFGSAFPRDELSMAAAVMISLPLLILFFIFQKQYIQGIVITGVK